MKNVYPNRYYAKVYEEFTRKDGSKSWYYNIGDFELELMQRHQKVTKSMLKEKVEESLSRHQDLKTFSMVENEYGWEYTRFVKCLDDDYDNFEVVKEGEHTDKEVYTVEIILIEEIIDIFGKLKD